MSDEFLDSLKKRAEEVDGKPVESATAGNAAPSSGGGDLSWLLGVKVDETRALTAPNGGTLQTPEPSPETFGDVQINPPDGPRSSSNVELPFTLPPTVESVTVNVTNITNAPAPTEEKPATRRGRPKGSKNKKDEQTADTAPTGENVITAPGLATFTELPDETEANEETPKRESRVDFVPADVERGYTLYIDCHPEGVAYFPAERLISDAKAEVTRQDWPDGKGGTHKVADYRYLPYGQGPGALAATVLSMIQADPLPPHVVVSTRSPEGQIIVADLAANAAFVVRGAA